MKIRMRFIQNGQWRQQKGCDKKWRHRRLRFVFGVSFGVTLGVKKKKARGLTPLTCAFDGGRYKIRTCDPIRVKDMLYPLSQSPVAFRQKRYYHSRAWFTKNFLPPILKSLT